MIDREDTLIPGQIAGPGEWQQSYGGAVVDKHLYKVLPLDIKPLRYGERPVEGELHHVVPPDWGLNIVVWIVIPDNIQQHISQTNIFVWRE